MVLGYLILEEGISLHFNGWKKQVDEMNALTPFSLVIANGYNFTGISPMKAEQNSLCVISLRLPGCWTPNNVFGDRFVSWVKIGL